MPRFLGIDYGLSRTGLSVTDPEGRLVFPLRTLCLKDFKNRKAFLDALCEIVQKENIDELVIGLPLYEDGSENLSCAIVRNVANKLKRRLNLPVYFMPELLSSAEALSDLKEAHIKRGKIKKVLDQQAACRILESFLTQSEQRRIPL